MSLVMKIICVILVCVYVNTGAGFAQEQKSLKEIFKGKFLIGAAVNDAQCSDRDAQVRHLLFPNSIQSRPKMF